MDHDRDRRHGHTPSSRPGPSTGTGSDRRAQSAFRICTAQSFGSASSKRKAGHTMTACEMCRARKVKCIPSDVDDSRSDIENETGPKKNVDRPPCRPCQLANLTCMWTCIDARRKRHRRPHTLQDAATEKHHPETTVCDDPRPQPSGPFSQDLNGLAIAGDDWADVENFVVGFDFLDMAGSFDAGNLVYHPQTHVDGGQQTSPDNALLTPRTIRLRYYRRFGPTAVLPGLRTLSVVVHPEEETQSWPTPPTVAGGPPGNSPSAASMHSRCSTSSAEADLFEPTTNAPNQKIMVCLLDVFFRHFGGHFPFLNPQVLGGHVQSGEASSFQLNAIAALAARFWDANENKMPVDLPRQYQTKWQRGRPFLKKAKEQLMSLLSIPSPDVVAGLIILAWAEYGDGNEAGLWMFAGMAIRMVQDLGFYRAPEPVADPEMKFHDQARPSPDGSCILTDEQSAVHQQKARLVMFWSVFVMDVCVSLVTGRTPSIRRSEIEVAVPTAADMKHAQLDFSEPISAQNVIFPETVRFMLLMAEAVEALNGRALAPVAGRDANLTQIRSNLLHQYRQLPPQMAFSIDNYREATQSLQSGLFLLLHLFFLTLMNLLAEGGPDITSAPAAAQRVSQILTVAHLVDTTGYLGTPLMSHCLFVAASTMLKDMDGQKQDSGSDLMAMTLRADYEFLYGKLNDYAEHYGAVQSMLSVLDTRSSTNRESDARHRHETGDQSGSSVERVVEINDMGIVHRYTIPP